MAAVSARVVAPPAAGRRAVPYRFTVEQYHRMIDNGVLGNARCELLEGVVVEKVTHNPRHDSALTRIQRRLSRLLPDDWILRVQCAISAGDSEPEPDLTVVRGPEERYDTHHPVGRDIGLIVEVADTSLDQDRFDKKRIHASIQVPAYWIANMVDEQIEVYTRPYAARSPTYRQRHDFRRDSSVPVLLRGKEIARLPVRELLP
jgi:Uma2 family endonuclease